MPIPEWKWERIAMDFVVGLPKIMGKYDSICVIVDRLTKSAHEPTRRIRGSGVTFRHQDSRGSECHVPTPG